MSGSPTMGSCPTCGYAAIEAQCDNPACLSNPNLTSEAFHRIAQQQARYAEQRAERDMLRRAREASMKPRRERDQ